MNKYRYMGLFVETETYLFIRLLVNDISRNVVVVVCAGVTGSPHKRTTPIGHHHSEMGSFSSSAHIGGVEHKEWEEDVVL